MEQFLYFLRQKYTPVVLLQLKADFVFSNINHKYSEDIEVH